jgi:putative addiction module killer protein
MLSSPMSTISGAPTRASASSPNATYILSRQVAAWRRRLGSASQPTFGGNETCKLVAYKLQASVIEVRETTTFSDWMRKLRDSEARARIAARVRRLAFGSVGDSKSIGEGVSELRIHHGPGYRVYFVTRGNALFVLLCGGDKSSQAKDIILAKRLAAELKE